MSQENKAVVSRWFTEYWGALTPTIVDELAAADMVLRYPLGGVSRGHGPIKERIIGFERLFPDGGFELIKPLIAEDTRVVAHWKGTGTHTGPAWELPVGTLEADSGRAVEYTGITIYEVRDGKIVEEYGEGDYVSMVQQLGLIDPS